MQHKQPAYFIECPSNLREYSKPIPIKFFKWTEKINRKFNLQIVAIFKIYPK